MAPTLKTGLVAQLTRSRPFRTEHMVVHVTGRYTKDFVHQGSEQGHSVRNAKIDTSQQKVVNSGQWRTGAAVESGGVIRQTGPVSTALVPAGALEVRHRSVRLSGAQLSGQEIRLNGGTPHSEAFGNDLELTVHIYSYVTHLGHDPKSTIKVGRTVHQRLPRTTTDEVTQPYTRELVPGQRFRQFTRLRLVETRPVTVLFDNASVTETRLDHPVTFKPRPDPMNVNRATQLELGTLRTWVDSAAGQPAKVTVIDWLSVDDLPAGTFILQLAQDALKGAQTYGDELTSRTKLGGLRGTDSLLEGMPAWASLIRRFADHEQVGGLRPMLNDQWTLAKVMTSADGAAVDLTVSAALVNPELIPTRLSTITTETATVGGASVDGTHTSETQVVLRGGFSTNLRKPGTTESTSGGGGLISATHEWLLHSFAERDSFEIGGLIERNANNRKGKMRSFLVKFDMRASVAAEITTDPAKYAILPQAIRFGDWLHHVKSIERHGTFGNAIYLRLTGEEAQRIGVLKPLKGDTGSFGAPWTPGPDTQLRLPAGHGAGLGLYTFHGTPTLTYSMIRALTAAAEDLGAGKGGFAGLLDVIKGNTENRSVAKISSSVSGSGLDDPMLNRRRLLHLLTPDGVAEHWPSMADGGISVLHMKPGKMTQHSRDIRLIAEPDGKPIFEGFVANHDDVDVKMTHLSDAGKTVQRTHGHTETLGAAGTGVSNLHGENFAAGLGDTVGRTSQVANSQGHGQANVNAELSSARGVKARLKFPVKFSLVIFDKGTRIDSELLVVNDFVTQDRWADDLRLPRTIKPGDALPQEYVIKAPESMGPGWRTLNDLPLPPRFTPEDISRLAELQGTIEGLLTDAAKRLKTPGYGGAHQIHQSLTPEILLPAVPKMMTENGLDLPSVVSAQILGQRAKINLKIVPEGAALSGVSSGVYREHAPSTTIGYSSGTNSLVQSLSAPRVPIFSRGFPEDSYQGLEAGGPGLFNGDSQAATESIGTSTGALGNVKPESASAAIDYLSRVEITITLPRTIGFAQKPITGADTTTVTLRMGLHDAKTALDIPTTVDDDPTGRAAAFDKIVQHEAGLAKAADRFIAAADSLDAARFEAHSHPEASPARAQAEAELPALLDAWDKAGQDWWALEQRHYELLDDFRQKFLGVSSAVTADRSGSLGQQIMQQFLDSVEPPPLAPKTTQTAPPPDPVPLPLVDKAVPPASELKEAVAPLDKAASAKPSGAVADPAAKASEPKVAAGIVPPEAAAAESQPVKAAPVEAAPVKAAPVEAAPATGELLRAPGDGRCQLYSIVGSDPVLVGQRLQQAGIGSDFLRNWLNDADRVRGQVTHWRERVSNEPGSSVPINSLLGSAGDGLRLLVERYLQNAGDSVPAQVLQAYRHNRAASVESATNKLTGQALHDRLDELGIQSVTDGALLPIGILRPAYIDARTIELTQSGATQEAARAAAIAEVRLNSADDVMPQVLSDDALSMRGMFEYLAGRNIHFDPHTLPEQTMRDLILAHLADPARPLDRRELRALTDAVKNWQHSWQADVGEGFVVLLAAALDVRIQIIQPNMPAQTVGREGAPLIQVHRAHNHYDALTPPPPSAPAPTQTPPTKTVTTSPGHPPTPTFTNLDEAFGEAVWPKKVKPFELDPPRKADEKGVKGEALEAQEVRLNPAWMPLSDFTPSVYGSRPEATWHYVVNENGEIFLGSEEIHTVVKYAQLQDLHAGMQAKNPDLTLDQLRDIINQQGHPTIGARFTKDGRALAGKARVSGELNWDSDAGTWIVNDKSGRYMSGKVRPGLQASDVQRWLNNVATLLRTQLGQPVEPRLFKHAAPPPPPEQQITQQLIDEGWDPAAAKILGGGA